MRKVLLFAACVPLWAQTTPGTGEWIGLTPGGYRNQVAGYDGCAYTGSTNNTVLCFDDYNTIGVTSEVQDTMLQFDYPNNRWTLLTNGGRWRSTHRPSGGHQMGVFMYIPALNSVVWQTNYSFSNTIDTYARMYGWDIGGLTGFEMPVPTNGGVITRPWLQNTGGALSETAVDNTTTNRWAIFPDERQGAGDASICTLSAGVLFTCTHASGSIPVLGNFGMAAEGGRAFITNGLNVYTLNFATGTEVGPLPTTCTGADCAGNAPSARFGTAFAWSPDDQVFMLAGGSTVEGGGSAIIDTWMFNPATNAWTELCGPNLNPTGCAAFSFLPTKPGMRLVYDTHDHVFIWVQPGGAVAIYAIGTVAPLAYGSPYTLNVPPSGSLNKTTPPTTANSTAQGWASDVNIFNSGSNVYVAHTEPAPPSGSGNCIPPIPYVSTAAGAYFPTGNFGAGCSAIGFNTGIGMQIASHTMGTAANGQVWTAFAKERIDNPIGTVNSLAFALATTPPSSSSNTWTNPNFPPQAVTATIPAGSNTITLSPFPGGVQNGSVLLIQNSLTGPTGTDEYVPVTNANFAASQITITTINAHSGTWHIGDSGEVGCFTRACTYATTYKLEQRPASIITNGTTPVMAVIEQDVSTNAHDEYLYVARYGSVWTQVGTGKVNVYGSGTHVQSATLATDGTNPAVCWVEYVDNESNRSIMTTTPQLYCKHWSGSAWSSMGTGSLNQNSTDYVNDPSLTYYNGYFYVAWTERTPNGWPQVLVYSYNGSSWSQVGSGSLNISTNTGIAYHPVLAADGNSALYVSWEEQSALGQHNLGNVRTWNGTSWPLLSSTVAQDTVNGSIEDLGIVANAGTITAAWSELSAGNLRQLYVTELSEVAELPGTLVSLAVTPSNPSLAAGASQQFTATGTYNTGITQNLTGSVTWSSSVTGVATINGSGLARGVAPGSATVTAASGSVSGSTTVTVSVLVSGVACAPASLGQSAVSTCTVTLTQTAPADGSNVTLASNNPLLRVPALVLVPVGGTTATFSATAAASIAANQTAAVTATAGSSSQTTTIGLLAPVLVSALACAPASLGLSAISTCTVTLTQTAPAGGSKVTLASNNASLTVPASVLVAAAATTATFSATAGAGITGNQSATVTATLGGSSQSASIALLPVTVSGLACSPATFTAPGSVSCTITLSGAAPVGGLSVSLSSGNPQAVVPASLFIPAGSATGSFTATVSAVSASGGAVITASADGSTQSASIAFTPDQVSSVSCSEATVPSGSSTSCTVTLVSVAPAAGETVTLSSGNSGLTVPASVAVAAGATTATFTAAATGTLFEQVWLTASLNGSSTTTPVAVSAFQILGNPSEVSGSSNGAIVTPAVAPSGFTGTLVVTGAGAAQFAPVGNGSGVSFLNCCSNTNTAHYKFTGAELGSIFNVNQGQISFHLKSSYSFAQRQATAAAKRYAFDVQDNVATTHHLFYFLTEIYSNSSAAYLTFSYSVGGAAQFYYVPLGTENTLYGNGVALQVTITWNGSTSNLYFNGTLVQTETYTVPAAAWTAGSVFDLGATEYLTNGGYDSSDDLISGFTVGVPQR